MMVGEDIRMKQTDIPWMPEVPEHWDVYPLWALFADNKEKNADNSETTVLSLSYGSLVRRDVESNHGLLPESFSTYQVLEPGYIILRLTDLQNDKTSLRVGYTHEKGIITSAYTGLVPKHENVYPEFYYYLLHAFDICKVFYSQGGGVRQSMSYEDLRWFKLPVPPYGEQVGIVHAIKSKSREVTTFIKKKQRFIELLKEQRSAIINQAVTKGLNPDAPMRDSGIEWLGEVPAHWEVTRIKFLLNGIIDTEHKTVEFVDDGRYLVVRTSNIKEGKLVLDEARYTDEKGFEEWTRRGVPEPGDIVLTREAPVGEGCIIPADVNLCLGQRVVWLKVKKELLLAEYGVFCIYSDVVKNFIRDLSMGSTVEHLNMSEIPNIPILKPAIEEQRQIIEFLHEEINKIDQAIEKAKKEIELIKEYRESMIAEAVMGKDNCMTYDS